jgi:hypothetical protein
MMPNPRSRQTLSKRELQIFRSHGEWASRFIVYSLVACFVILGGAFAIFEYTGADERARTPSLILLATMIVINVIWRAAAEVAARIELMLMARGGGESGFVSRRP